MPGNSRWTQAVSESLNDCVQQDHVDAGELRQAAAQAKG